MNQVGRDLRANPRARVGFGIVAFLCLAAILGPLFSPYGPSEQPDVVNQQLLPPSIHHPLGTDHVSRDVMIRVVYGARISLFIAMLSVFLSSTIGTGIGLVAGFTGGMVDSLVMRAVDAALAIPRILLLLIIFALWGQVSVAGLIIIFAVTSWFGTSRIVRAEVMGLRNREFVLAADALGFGQARVLVRHLLPNVAAPVIVAATLGVGQIVLMEAGLSYLGIGVRDPTATLGHIIQDGYGRLLEAPWISVFPGLVIVLTVIGFSLIGDALRDSLDPRTP